MPAKVHIHALCNSNDIGLTLIGRIRYLRRDKFILNLNPLPMKNMMFVLFLLIGGAAFAQQAATQPVGNEVKLKSNAVLAELAAKVNAANDAVKASATGSRASGQEAQAGLKAACDAYRAELNKQLGTATDAETINALKREIAAVNVLSPAAAQELKAPSKR